MTLKQQVIAEALTANPTMPTHTLARLVFKANFPLWTNPTAVRDMLRSARRGQTFHGKFAGQSVAVDLGGTRPTSRTLRARELCRQFPNTATAALARILAREFAPLSFELARSQIRYARNKLNR